MANAPLEFMGVRSTDAAKACLAACMRASGDGQSAALCEQEVDWRSNYYLHFLKANELMLKRSPQKAIDMCFAGLKECRSVFGVDGTSLAQIETGWQYNRDDISQPTFLAEVIVGTGARTQFACPIGRDSSKNLYELVETLRELVHKGAAEPSVVKSIERLCANESWLDGKSTNHVFAVLGAGSQMGPARTLLSMGCTVIAIDLDGRPQLWEKLIEHAKSTNGTLIMPKRLGSSTIGCNVLTEFIHIAEWILNVANEQCPGKRIVVATFLYADGALFSRLAVAADAIAAAILSKRPDTALQSLCSPTECFSVPIEANKEASRRYHSLSVHTPWMRLVETISMGRYLERNAPLRVMGVKESGRLHLLQDSFVWQQGPNYAFSKLVQRWRNLIHWWHGGTVSSNVAPASLTVSVMHNRLIRAGMLGCQFFGIVPFEPETSNSLMTALALHDLNHNADLANSDQEDPRKTHGGHPLDLFQSNAVHGGTWRCAFKTNSYTEVSAVIYGLKFSAPFGAAILAAAMAGKTLSKL